MLNGKFATFALADGDDAERAALLLAYFDRKYPQCHEVLLRPAIPSPLVRLSFQDGVGAGTVSQERRIGCGRCNDAADFGYLIHEAVHLAQMYPHHIYAEFTFLSEAIADYFRIVLSDDRMGDVGNECKRWLTKAFDPEEPYNCGSEFLGFLRRRSCAHEFIVSLNACLNRGDADTVRQFFVAQFGMPWEDLMANYAATRASRLGRSADQIERFSYLVSMTDQSNRSAST